MVSRLYHSASADHGSDGAPSVFAKLNLGDYGRIGPGLISILTPLAIVLVVGYFGFRSLLNGLLVQQASSTGMVWAHHIAARLPNISVASNASGKRHLPPKSKEFMEMVNGVFSAGNVYQIDIINPGCYCQISLGSFAAKSGGTPHGGHRVDRHHTSKGAHKHLHAHRNSSQSTGGRDKAVHLPQSTVQHVFKNRKKHGPPVSGVKAKGHWPVDRGRLQSIIANRQHKIFIHENVDVNQPNTFGEVLHPVVDNGDVLFVIRILVDLQHKKAEYYATLQRGSGLALLLLLCFSGMPVIWYFNAARRQETANSRIRYLAVHDTLTGIANRNAFQEQAPKILAECEARGEAAVLILLDLNKFKEINDQCGHLAGDQLLQQLAQKLKINLPRKACVARMGGDEFVTMFWGLDRATCDELDYSCLPKEVSFTCDQSGQTIAATVSSGAACYPRDGSTLEKLLQNADFALYDAKSITGGGLRVFDQKMRTEFEAAIALRAEFLSALENSEIEPFYQPLMNLNTGQIEGFESLARWRHPEKGILTPDVFDELLTDREIGRMVCDVMFEKVVRDMKAWKQAGVPFESIGLNIGQGDLQQPNFAQNILSTLSQNGLVPSDFAVEITETCMFDRNKWKFIKQLERLRAAGCYIALDDFGTGFSSILQIKELPYTAVKIDKSFVFDVERNEADRAIIGALLKLGDTVGFKVVLEGVETAAQRDLLNSLGCEMAQGFLFARPVPAARVPHLIKSLNGQQNEYTRKSDAMLCSA